MAAATIGAPQMSAHPSPVARGSYNREVALQTVRDCQQKAVENEAALWINAAVAINYGATLAQIAAIANCSTETARRKLVKVRGG